METTLPIQLFFVSDITYSVGLNGYDCVLRKFNMVELLTENLSFVIVDHKVVTFFNEINLESFLQHGFFQSSLQYEREVGVAQTSDEGGSQGCGQVPVPQCVPCNHAVVGSLPWLARRFLLAGWWLVPCRFWKDEVLAHDD